jgi:hypothetical protein
MKTLVYQMMEQPEWVEKIRKGIFEFSATVSEEEQMALVKAAKEEAQVEEHFWRD